jgi:hypothetical protein
MVLLALTVDGALGEAHRPSRLDGATSTRLGGNLVL